MKRALDALDGGIGLFHSDGSPLYLNRTMRRAWHGALGAEVTSEITGTVRKLVEEFRQRTPASPAQNEIDVCVASEERRYRLRAGCISEGVGTQCLSFVVSLDEVIDPTPPEDELRGRFGLTKQEVQVALLLAEGANNRELANRLFLSEHTTRNYTRRVLSKLGVDSRSRVGPVLRGTELAGVDAGAGSDNRHQARQ